MEIVDAGNKNFTVGVATADIRNSTDEYYSDCNLCIKGNGRLFSGGNRHILRFKLTAGDRIIVVRTENDIEWLQNGQSLYITAIPGCIADKKLYPVCWIESSKNASKISKLKFT